MESKRKSQSIAMKKLWKNPEYRKKNTKSNQERWTDNLRQENSIRMKKVYKNNPNLVKIHSANSKKRWKSPAFIKKMQKISQSAKFIEKQRQSMQQLWKNEKYRQTMLPKLFNLLSKRKPSDLEIRIINIISQNQLPWKFVGNGKLIIADKNPDFVHANKKIIAEAYSKHWKSIDGKTVSSWKRNRERLFAQLGYKTIFIYYHDSNDSILKSLMGN
jgi:hypothetical protein